MDNVNQHLKHFCFVVCLSAIGFSFSGCGPSPAQLAIQESFTKARAEFRASDVRTAVLLLFKKYNHFDMDETIPTAEIPQIVSSLPMFKIAIPYDVHGFALESASRAASNSA